MTSPTTDTTGTAPSTTDEAQQGAPRKPRAARRIPKTDVVLEAASERARLGVLEVAPEEQVGRHVSAVVEGERLVTHRFEAFVPGYGGWQWFATVARVARSKEVTVCEMGLLPSAASLLAPEWLPWSERVRPEDSQPEGQSAVQQGEQQPGPASGSSESSDGAVAAGAGTTTVEAGEVPDQPTIA